MPEKPPDRGPQVHVNVVRIVDRRDPGKQEVKHIPDRRVAWKSGDELHDIPTVKDGDPIEDEWSAVAETDIDTAAQIPLVRFRGTQPRETPIPAPPDEDDDDESGDYILESEPEKSHTGLLLRSTIAPVDHPPSPPPSIRKTIVPRRQKPSMSMPQARKSAALPPASSKWRSALFGGIAALAGVFGIKIGFEKVEEATKEGIEAASDALDYYSGKTEARMAKFPPALFDQQPIEPPDAEDKKEPLTRTYTVEPTDTLWGYAGKLVDSVGIEDPDGTITLETVKKLREANDIQGDAATSKKMWAGKTIDVTSAYDFVVSQKFPQDSQSPEEPLAEDSQHVQSAPNDAASAPDVTTASPAPSPELESPYVSHNAKAFSPELLSPTLNPGETIWSRTHDMLESLGMKPNMAKRGVLGAIVLADSHMTESQAMRIKYAGHKKFDATRDTLNFDRAAQAALDLQNGMSPGDVAKKYGVKNVYEKIRDR